MKSLKSLKRLKETDSTDIDYTPTSKVSDDTFKRKLLNLVQEETNDAEQDNGELEDIDFETIEPANRDEIKEILNSLDEDEQALIISAINDNYDASGAKNYKSTEELINDLNSIDDSNFFEISDIVLSVLGELEAFYDSYEEYNVETDLDEKLINIAHTRNLRRQRAKSAWKRNAVLRARFRKTAEGKRAKRKAKIYLKKYRKAKKTRLKRYSQEYSKELAKKSK